MTLFEALLLGHLIGDFLFQNQWMAQNKTGLAIPRLVHCLVYTVLVYAFSYLAGGIGPIGAGVILLSHFLIDRRSFVLWWAKCVTRSDITWLFVVYDQVFHLLILAAVVSLKL